MVENEYNKLLKKAEKILENLPEDQRRVKKWNKDEHLKKIQESEKFRYSKEIVFHNKETSDAERYIGLALSQGAIQTIFKKGISDIDGDIENFKKVVRERFDNKMLDLVFSYRMRIGIK
ncbi:hypothetical protein [Tepidibacillus marianensis]|uniref:hypothetical protein n=1 Tax=Tepidibacillus marianensis TaxID=3131995 RepID=UPI0030D3639D